MDKRELRERVFQSLKKNPQTHVHTIENEIRQHAEGFERHDTLTLQEVVWELLVQGVLAPGKNSLNLNLPFVHLTEYGARCVDDGTILVHDPDGYVARLIETCGGRRDDVVVESAREGLLAFLAGHHAAALVMLARAAETLIDLLFETVARQGRHSDLEAQALEPCGAAPRARYDALHRALDPSTLTQQLAEELEPRLSGLQALIDLSRAETGRPRVPTSTRDDVLARFLMLPEQCRFVHDLIDHLERPSAD